MKIANDSIKRLINAPNKLGFGSLRFPRAGDGNVDTELVSSMFDEYIKSGGLYFEAAYNYYQAESTIRKCLVERYPRESFMLADKMPVNEVHATKDYETIFNNQLKKCGVQYFDFYLLHSVSYKTYANTEKLGGFEFINGLKEKGYAKSIGFSFHDTAEVLEEILAKYHNIFDFVQLQINYLDWDSPVIQSKRCFDIATKFGLPIFVMEPIKGGRLINLPDEAKSLIENGSGSAAELALKWVGTKQSIVCVLSGMNKLSQVKSNIRALIKPIDMTQGQLDTIQDVVKIVNSLKSIQCTACRYCIPVCPKKIPITELLYLSESDNLNHTGRMYERITEGKGKAGDCLKCGRCEQVCSQHLPIRKHLIDIASEYENSTICYRILKNFKGILIKFGILNFARKLKRSFEDRKM